MRRYRYEIDNVRAHLRSLWVIIGLQLLADRCGALVRLESGTEGSDGPCAAGSAIGCGAGGG